MIKMTKVMEKYSSYKDSGVKWLGEIPSHWEMRKMKYVFKIYWRIFAARKRDALSRLLGEESPDRTGHLAVESTDGRNLIPVRNRKLPPARVRMKTRGKSPRPVTAMPQGYGIKACKTKYTGR